MVKGYKMMSLHSSLKYKLISHSLRFAKCMFEVNLSCLHFSRDLDKTMVNKASIPYINFSFPTTT